MRRNALARRWRWRSLWAWAWVSVVCVGHRRPQPYPFLRLVGPPMPLSPIPDILDDLRRGKIVVLVDDERRENEGDFICAAEFVSVEIINFMTRVGGGYLCVPVTGEICDRLDLGPAVAQNTSVRGT